MPIPGATARLRPHRPSLSTPRRLLRAALGLLLAAGLSGGLAPRAVRAQTTAEAGAVSLSARLQYGPFSTTAPNQITLNWQQDPNATSYTIFRKAATDNAFQQLAQITTGAATADQYVDTTLTAQMDPFYGTFYGPYEYEVVKQASGYTGTGYIYAGINVPASAMEARGTVLLVVDRTLSTNLAVGARLARFQQDLIGDGWNVVRVRTDPSLPDVPRDPGIDNAGVPLDRNDPGGAGHTVRDVKAAIRAAYQANPNVRAVLLFGHVPVPYSGRHVPPPDARLDDHAGAWPADEYYGDMGPETDWTDSAVNVVTSSDPRNFNIPGDGKFDQDVPTGPITLEVGRVDLANLPSFGLSEPLLLAQYLDKDHNYRQTNTNALGQGRIDDNFGYANDGFGAADQGIPGSDFAATAFRNFGAFFGTDANGASGITQQLPPGLGSFVGDTRLGSFLWSYGDGTGTYTSAANFAATTDFAANDPHTVFYMMFGEFFGDWDHSDDLLRAPLATPTYGLTNAWAGRPAWYLQHMALGREIGYGTLLTQNNGFAFPGTTEYDPVPATGNGAAGNMVPGNGTWAALMGDPTLRQQMATPPSGVSAVGGAGGVKLTWNPSPDRTPAGNYGGVNVGYNVYRAPTAAGPFVRLNAALVVGTGVQNPVTFTDASPLAAAAVYEVRAASLQTSGSGSYFNLSQGVFQGYDPNSPAPTVQIVAPTNFETPNGAPGTFLNPNGGPYNQTNGALFTAPATFLIAADAAPGVATGATPTTIARVDFFNGSTLIGSATSAPYRASLAGLPAGQYLLSAVATDSKGNTATSQTVRVYVFQPEESGTVAQTVLGGGGLQDGWFDLAPLFGDADAASGGSIMVTAPAGGVFALGHAPFDTSPYSTLTLNFTLDGGTMGGQKFVFSAPIEGFTAVAPLQVVGPLPPGTSTFSIPISGFAGTAPGAFTPDFYQQTNLDGFTLQDVTGAAQTFAVSNVTLTENPRRGDAAPTVVINSPANGTNAAAPYSVTLTANAADSDSAIGEVDLYDSGVFVEAGTPPPASSPAATFSTYTFTLTNVPPGVHNYTAVAVSTLGNSTTSAPVTVTVQSRFNLAGLVSSTQNGATAPQPGATVTVTDANGVVAATFTTGPSVAGPDGIPINYPQAPTNGGTAALPPGTYTITAVAFGFSQTAPQTVILTTGGFKRVDLNLSTLPPTVDGLVTAVPTPAPGSTATQPPAPQPLAGATVTLTNAAGAVVATTTTTTVGVPSPDGQPANYLVNSVPAGTYTVSAAAPGYGVATRQVTLAAGQPMRADLVLPAAPSQLGGLVADAANGGLASPTPVAPGQAVKVTDGSGNVQTFTTTATANGPDSTTSRPRPLNYLGSLAPGAYTAQASTTSEDSARVAVTVNVQAFTRADLTLTPRLTALTVAPATGTSAAPGSFTGTVTLAVAAPAGGITVLLSVSNTGAASVPATVTIPQGATSATFTVTPSAVGAATQETVTATQSLNDDTQTATLTVNPEPLSGLSFSPTTIGAGGTSTGTVSVNSAAPAGGLLVSLQSGNTGAASVPATVTIPQGATSATFTATGGGVAASTPVTVTATLGGVSQTATLTVQPATLLSVSVAPTSAAATLPVTGTVTLSGPAPAGGLTVYLRAAGPASVPASVTVLAGATSATFTVTTFAAGTATITASTDPTFATSAQTAVLTVSANSLGLSLSRPSVPAGTPLTGTLTLTTAAVSATVVTVSSSSPAATVPATVTIPQGAKSATFPINTSAPATVTISAGLNPSVPAASATLTITANPGFAYKAGLNMISLPYDLSGASLSTVFGFPNPQVYVWQPLQFQYAISPAYPADAIRLGVGYWVRFPQDTTVSAVGPAADVTRNFTVPLSQGWNMVGDPFAVAVPIGRLQTNVGGNITTAFGGQILAAYGYTPGGSYYGIGSGGTLQPGQGYWLYAAQPLTLVFPHP